MLLAALASVAGCAHYAVNEALTAPARAGAYRFPDLTPPAAPNTDSLFVCLTFSGGGTRAAALAYGVMEKLRQTTITWEGTPKPLLSEVDCISSVSGGSFTAAYYGLFGDRLFTDFRPRFLDRNIQRELAVQLLNPVALWRLASPYFGRSDLAAELYDRTIFERRTFRALAGRRPFIILNATDLATGRRFEFTQ
ncbi:MAG: patatin-like phospholipase family protein, partial [Candidatus Rokubacteria bacterium]|nr:patatin-like phospholipase family protein [Candidatus Rokubacteria bacterium]